LRVSATSTNTSITARRRIRGCRRLRDAISRRITEAKPVPGAWIAAFACYSPLSSLPDCSAWRLS
jgi:hypothetical protein